MSNIVLVKFSWETLACKVLPAAAQCYWRVFLFSLSTLASTPSRLNFQSVACHLQTYPHAARAVRT